MPNRCVNRIRNFTFYILEKIPIEKQSIPIKSSFFVNAKRFKPTNAIITVDSTLFTITISVKKIIQISIATFSFEKYKKYKIDSKIIIL
jgi:hypothetical protein